MAIIQLSAAVGLFFLVITTGMSKKVRKYKILRIEYESIV